MTLKWKDEYEDGDGDGDKDKDKDKDKYVKFALFTRETGFVPMWN